MMLRNYRNRATFQVGYSAEGFRTGQFLSLGSCVQREIVAPRRPLTSLIYSHSPHLTPRSHQPPDKQIFQAHFHHRSHSLLRERSSTVASSTSATWSSCSLFVCSSLRPRRTGSTSALMASRCAFSALFQFRYCSET
jgi:hypothetical protein